MSRVYRKRLPASCAALLIGAGLFGCGPATGTTPKPPTGSQEEAASGSAQQGYQELIGARTIHGSPVLRQARPTAVVFFASWCGPCRRELADLALLREKYPSLRVIGLNAYEDYGNYSDEQRLRAFLDSNAPWMTEVVHASPGLLQRFGKVPKIPTLFVYDASGQIVAEFRRDKRALPTQGELDSAIAAAIGASD